MQTAMSAENQCARNIPAGAATAERYHAPTATANVGTMTQLTGKMQIDEGGRRPGNRPEVVVTGADGP